MRATLETRLKALPDVTVAPWKDTDLVSVAHKGKEVGHFHGDDVIDLRLSPKVIRDEGLSRDISAAIHPDRPKTSRWIGVRFRTEADVTQIVRLVKLACDLR